MKVLLMGEYSGVHNNLSKALKEDGHEVLLISDGDSYKSFDSDFYIRYIRKTSENKLFSNSLRAYYILLNFSGLKGSIQILKYRNLIRELKDYDVVQLINPIFLSEYGSVVNYIVFKYLKKHNKKIFLSALGDDYYWVKFCMNKGFEHSMFDRYNLKNIKSYLYSLQYIYGLLYPYLNKYIAKNVNAILPGLYDYYLPYRKFNNCTEIVPIIIEEPLNIDEPIEHAYPIRIFHGWQEGKALRKGNDLFDKAIKKVVRDYQSKVQYEIVSGLPYSEYIKKFDGSHIFIDQCYSQDTGVNALLGMRLGKVVFSGFSKPLKEYFNIDYDPLVNTKPSEKQIYDNIVRILNDPTLIKKYSLNAKRFIKEFHSSQYVLEKYYRIWHDY